MSFDPAAGRILDAALPHFAERGYENTRIDAIASDADVDVRLLHALFATKAALFGVLLNRELERAREQVISAVPTESAGRSIGGAVGLALEDLLSVVRAAAPSWRLVLLADFGSFGDAHARDELRDVLRTRLRWLVASGLHLPKPELLLVAEVLAAMLAALLEVSIQPLLSGERVTEPATVAEALDTMLTLT